MKQITKSGFLGISSGTLGATLLGNKLTGKGVTVTCRRVTAPSRR